MNTFLVRSAYVLNTLSKFPVRQANAEYVDIRLMYVARTLEVCCLSVRNTLCIRYSKAQQATSELQRITTFVSV